MANAMTVLTACLGDMPANSGSQTCEHCPTQKHEKQAGMLCYYVQTGRLSGAECDVPELGNSGSQDLLLAVRIYYCRLATMHTGSQIASAPAAQYQSRSLQVPYSTAMLQALVHFAVVSRHVSCWIKETHALVGS